MKFIEQLNIKLSQLIKPNFIPKNIEITELYLTDFTLFNYNITDFTYYPRRMLPEGGNKTPVMNDLSSVKNFIEKTNLDDFINVEKFNRYYNEIVSTYISVLLEEVRTGSFKNTESFLKDHSNLKLILKSPKYSYKFLESKNLLEEDYYNKHKDDVESALLDDNLFWAYKYSYYILDGPFEKLEDDPRFIENDSLVNKYFTKIVFRRGFFDPKKDLLKLFYRYWNHPTLKISFKKILSTVDMIECFYFLRDYYIPELEEFFIETRMYAFVDYFVDITFYDNHMKLEDQYIGEKTEDLDDKISRLSKIIIDDPRLLEIFIPRMKNKEDLFKRIVGVSLDQYILDNAEYIKKSLLKDLEIMIRFIQFNYLKRHSIVKKEFPEAIEAILKSKDPGHCFFYVSEIILRYEKDTDPKEIEPFLKIISTSSTYSLMYATITKKRFPEGEKAIFSDPENKAEYLELLDEIKEK